MQNLIELFTSTYLREYPWLAPLFLVLFAGSSILAGWSVLGAVFSYALGGGKK